MNPRPYTRAFFAGLLLFAAATAQAPPAGAQEAARRLEPPGERLARSAEPPRESLAALGQLVDALDAAGRWREAVPHLEQLAARDAGNAPRRCQLARWLSWLPQRRAESYAHFRQGLALDPRARGCRLAYAEALSWDPRLRAEAIAQYEEILRHSPGDSQARAGLAEVWSWQRRLARAEDLYDAVLAGEPAHAAALAGKGEVLTWSGRHFQAARTLERVPPAQRTLRWRLARANTLAALGRHREAAAHLQAVLAAQPGNVHALRLLDWGNDWRRPHLEAGFALMRSSGDPRTSRLDFDQPFAAVRFPVNAWSRLEAAYTPTRYFNRAAARREQRFGLAWEGHPAEHFRFRAAFSGAQDGQGSADLAGEFVAGWRLSDAWQVDAGFTRAPLLDSVQSAAGARAGGVFLGPARANLAHLEVRRYWGRQDVDVYLRPSLGAVTGTNLAANRRAGLDLGAGKRWRLPRDHSVRLGYAFAWFSFAEDLGSFPDPEPSSSTGGYFSPTQFFNHAAQATLDGRAGRRWSYQLLANLGVQQSETAFSTLDRLRPSSYARASQLLRLTANLHLTAAYEFTDVGGAFRRHGASMALRFFPDR